MRADRRAPAAASVAVLLLAFAGTLHTAGSGVAGAAPPPVTPVGGVPVTSSTLVRPVLTTTTPPPTTVQPAPPTSAAPPVPTTAARRTSPPTPTTVARPAPAATPAPTEAPVLTEPPSDLSDLAPVAQRTLETSTTIAGVPPPQQGISATIAPRLPGYAFPFGLALLIVAFLVTQHWLDRRDPKLRDAPYETGDAVLPFSSEG